MRPTLTVAAGLLGKELFYGDRRGVIVETEAYIGQNDPACHAAHGLTPRTQTMYMEGGTAYVYLIYGMYYCLNFVTERADFPAAVLIRAVCAKNTPFKTTNGPGKLCRYFGITIKDDKADIISRPDFGVNDTALSPPFITTPRVGIKRGTDKLWRFVAEPSFPDFV